MEIVKGKNLIPVEHYIDHFSKQNKDVEILLRYVFGREAICLADDNETSLTMSLEACSKVLESTNTDIKDIDMVIFSGLLPEHLMPQTALILHNKLGGKKDCLCFDMNSDCIGMISAFELVRGYFNGTSGKKKALIVGCDDVRVVVVKQNCNTFV